MSAVAALRMRAGRSVALPGSALLVVWVASWMAAGAVLLRAPVQLDEAHGLYARESGSTGYRWTSSRVTLPVRGWSEPTIVSMRMAAGGWEGRASPAVQLADQELPLAVIAVADQPRRYMLLLQQGTRMLVLSAPVAQPSTSDTRFLGVRLFDVAATRRGLPLEMLATATLAACAAMAVAAALAWLVPASLVAPVLATLLGLALRLSALARLPAGFFQDEAVGVVDALNLLTTGRDHYGHLLPLGAFEGFGDWVSPLLTYLQIPTVALLGSTPLAARLPGALAGALAVPVVYAVARALRVSGTGALVAALSAALSPWQILRTRIASPPALAPLCWALCLLAGLALVKRGGRREAIWLALAAGVGIYAYPTMKLAVPALVAASVVLASWQVFGTHQTSLAGADRLWRLVRRWWPAAALLVVLWLPFAVVTLSNENSAMRASRKLLRADSIGLWLDAWVQGYLTYWQPAFYFVSGDPSNGIQGQGAQLPIEAPLVLLGLGFVVWQIVRCSTAPQRAAWLLVAVTIVLAPLPASLMSPNPHLTRAVLAAPIFALLVGIGVDACGRLLRRHASLERVIEPAVAVMLVAMIAWQGMARYADYRRNYPALVEGKYRDGLRESVEQLVRLAPGYDEVWIDDAMSFAYIYVLAVQGVSPAETQATIDVDRPGTTFNTVRRVGAYRFVSLKTVPRELPTLAATVTSLGNSGYLIQEWQTGSRRVLLLRRM